MKWTELFKHNEALPGFIIDESGEVKGVIVSPGRFMGMQLPVMPAEPVRPAVPAEQVNREIMAAQMDDMPSQAERIDSVLTRTAERIGFQPDNQEFGNSGEPLSVGFDQI